MYMYIHKLLCFFFFSLLNLSFIYRALSQELKRVEGKMFFLHFKDGGDWNGRRQNDRRANDKSRNPRGSADTLMGAQEAEGRGGEGASPMGMTCISAGPEGHLWQGKTKHPQPPPPPRRGASRTPRQGEGPKLAGLTLNRLGLSQTLASRMGVQVTWLMNRVINSSCIGTLKREGTPASPPMSQI